MNQLDDDLVISIIDYLEVPDILRLSVVCQRFYYSIGANSTIQLRLIKAFHNDSLGLSHKRYHTPKDQILAIHGLNDNLTSLQPKITSFDIPQNYYLGSTYGDFMFTRPNSVREEYERTGFSTVCSIFHHGTRKHLKVDYLISDSAYAMDFEQNVLFITGHGFLQAYHLFDNKTETPISYLDEVGAPVIRINGWRESTTLEIKILGDNRIVLSHDQGGFYVYDWKIGRCLDQFPPEYNGEERLWELLQSWTATDNYLIAIDKPRNGVSIYSERLHREQNFTTLTVFDLEVFTSSSDQTSCPTHPVLHLEMPCLHKDRPESTSPSMHDDTPMYFQSWKYPGQPPILTYKRSDKLITVVFKGVSDSNKPSELRVIIPIDSIKKMITQLSLNQCAIRSSDVQDTGRRIKFEDWYNLAHFVFPDSSLRHISHGWKNLSINPDTLMFKCQMEVMITDYNPHIFINGQLRGDRVEVMKRFNQQVGRTKAHTDKGEDERLKPTGYTQKVKLSATPSILPQGDDNIPILSRVEYSGNISLPNKGIWKGLHFDGRKIVIEMEEIVPVHRYHAWILDFEN